MLTFIHKIQMWFFKRKQLTNVLMERIFIVNTYGEFLNDDETVYQEEADNLREEMVKKMEAKETLGENDQQEIMDLENKVKEVVRYKNVLEASYTAEKEILDFIEIIKQNLWK